MNLGQAGSISGTRDAGLREDPGPPRQEPDITPLDPGPSRGHIQIDEPVIPPEVRELLEQESELAGLEVDDDARSGYDEEEDEGYQASDHARSVYAMSMYPGVQPAFQVEQPYENGQDSATMCVPSPSSSGSRLTTA